MATASFSSCAFDILGKLNVNMHVCAHAYSQELCAGMCSHIEVGHPCMHNNIRFLGRECHGKGLYKMRGVVSRARPPQQREPLNQADRPHMPVGMVRTIAWRRLAC